MRPVPDLAVSFVKDHEGCKLTAYADVGGVWTVGYGHCGPEVTADRVISPGLAEMYLREDLEIAANRLWRVLDEAVIWKLSDHQYAALLSFVFNLGTPKATLWKVLNAQQFGRVPGELVKWIYANGRPVQGLINRRAAEVALWRTPDEPVHDSGCALHNEPYLPAGPCDCSVSPAKPASVWTRLRSLFA